MDTVQIFDTTLRDGEQSPGFSMNREEKLRLARQIEELGVDILEAGFPIASPGDLEATRAVAAEIKQCKVAALARARQDDVDAALRGLEPAAKPRLHLFLATSDLHLKHKLRSTREQALDQIAKMIRFARQHCPEIEFSAEDASRTEMDYLCQVVLAAVESGATIINLPDTVGYSTPDEYAEMFRKVRARLGAHPEVILSAHCHDDLGLALANSLAAIEAGVRQMECTINGIGERAGNASLEELAVALHVRQNHYQVETHLTLEKLYPTSRMLTAITGRFGAAEQSCGRSECFRARGGHPSGRHPEKSADVRDHRSGKGRRACAEARARETLGTERVSRAICGAGLRDLGCRTCGVLYPGHRTRGRRKRSQRSRLDHDHSPGAPRAYARECRAGQRPRTDTRELNSAMTKLRKKIALLPGDGIGPEVTNAAVQILQDCAAAFGHHFEFRELPFGGNAIDLCGAPLPDATLAECRASDAILLGAIGGPKWEGLPFGTRPEAGLLGIRKELGLYINLRPIRLRTALRDISPLRPERLGDCDFEIVRELAGDIYFGEHKITSEKASDLAEYSVFEIERVARYAFERAAARGNHLTSVDKANVLASSTLWRDTVSRSGARISEREARSPLRRQRRDADSAAAHAV